jgi:hypothetical protein
LARRQQLAEHPQVFLERQCELVGRTAEHQQQAELSGQVVGQGALGIGNLRR